MCRMPRFFIGLRVFCVMPSHEQVGKCSRACIRLPKEFGFERCVCFYQNDFLGVYLAFECRMVKASHTLMV